MSRQRWIGLFVAGLAACLAGELRADGLSLSPEIAWSSGDHRIRLEVASRLRWELWEALTENDDNLYAVRTRPALEYRWKDRFRLLAQAQLTQLLDLDDSASGAAAAYRANASNANAHDVTAVRIRQLFAEITLDPGSWLRVGRQDINMGTLVQYEEPHWRRVKTKRLSQRLVGTVGWTHGERSYDGVSARLALGGHVLHAFAAEPTTGVFEIDSGYKRQKDVIVAGLDWTVLRGTWLDDVELGAFFVAYSDDRQPSKVAGLFGDVEVYTLGASLLHFRQAGPGRIDLLLWGALQLGDYSVAPPAGKLDHLAGAFIAEAGYQLPDAWAEPWLRAGVNFASGDGSPGDGDHNTFFNVLPTNHLYYGYADQLAFQNLIDVFVQLEFAPLAKTSVELTFHQFWLHREDDARYFGTGAFSRTALGYVATPSGGAHDVGREIDVVVHHALHRSVSLSAGVSRLFGGGVFDGFADDDVLWAFAQVQIRY